MSKTYDHIKVENKWAKEWEKTNIYKTDIKGAKRPFYGLMMFPYPSSYGLHIGNMYVYIGVDIYNRYKRLNGYDVFEPIGFDSFGIHGENYALKLGRHPKEVIEENIKHFREDQLKRIGNMFDWSHEVITSHPDYYKWTQWIFVQLFKSGLAERREAPVNWCPSCKTVLADEQVIAGKCERCNSEVILKNLTQWFLKITKYADKLYENLNKIDWSKKTIDAQRNWIGKSVGAEVKFKLKDINDSFEVFTTRVETLYGVTFIAISGNNQLIKYIKDRKVLQFADKVNNAKNVDLEREKEGVFTGLYALHPLTNKDIPIWITNYVLDDYGTGIVMGVPAHDERDADFARKYKLDVKEVVDKNNKIINSDQFNELSVNIAREKILEQLSKESKGEKRIAYKLRDWGISRQRYWGPPIPIIYCDKCGIVPVPEKDLPVLLPESADTAPTGDGLSPLARIKEFVNTICPNCGGKAKRDTDVSDNFLDSAWYYLRYPSTDFDNEPFNKDITEKWLPVDIYMGGNEHAVLHLMYTRFIVMALHDMGYINFDEPFKKFRANGMIIKDGVKMSKSKGNIIVPEEYIQKYGADVIRMYLMFMAPLEDGGDFRDNGIKGIVRFVDKMYKVFRSNIPKGKGVGESEILDKLVLLENSVRKSIESLKYNTAISALMIFFKWLEINKDKFTSEEWNNVVSSFLIYLSVFAPHFAEEIWNVVLGNEYSIFKQTWPIFNKSNDSEVKISIQINSKHRDTLSVKSNIEEKDLIEYIYLNSSKIKRTLAKEDIKKIIYIKNKVINLIS